MINSGANWVRVDLHLHTPAVDSFSLPSGINFHSDKDKRSLVHQYVERLKNANIKVAAITDYNGIREEWLELIKKEAEKIDIHILPGVELSLEHPKYGLHILLIFEKEVDIEGVNTFLRSLDKNLQNPLTNGRTHRAIEPSYELEELIKEIRRKYNCLIIFAHPEDNNGLVKSFGPQQAAKLLKTIRPDALEHISEKTKQKLVSTGEVDEDFFTSLAVIENSDPKSLEDIGNKIRDDEIRATYIKLSAFDLDALKFALHDPEVRVRRYHFPKFTHDRITEIKVQGGGFLKNIVVNLAPEMNTLIGGRGVGKSAILEALRYALDLPIYSDESFRRNFVYAVVGSGGEIQVILERFFGEDKSIKYEIRRIIGKEPEVLRYDTKEKVNLYPEELLEFAPLIIGQKELYYVSIDPSFQLKLIDELIGEDVKKEQLEFERSLENLRQNARKIMELSEKISKKTEFEQELKKIDAKIEMYEQLGVVEKLKRFTDVLEDEEKLESAIEKVEETKDNILMQLSEAVDNLSGSLYEISRGRSELKFLLEEVHHFFSEFIDSLKQYATQLETKFAESLEKLKAIEDKWKKGKAPIEEEVLEIKKKLSADKLQPDELEELTREKAKLEPQLRELEKLEESLKDLEQERNKILDKIVIQRHNIFNTRLSSVEEINEKLKGRLKIKVKYEEDKKEFLDRLRTLLKGSKVSTDAIDAMCNASKTIDGVLLSKYIKEGEERLIHEFDLRDTMARRIANWFFDEKSRIFELETLFPEDKIAIQLRVNDEYKNLEELSVGQKATALLLLLFAQENRILILDQPEEDLDNRFIYEDVVKILREMKGRRQIIIATHNANIPVLGDSELILVLESREEHCEIVDKGSIDKNSIRKHIKDIMEGGEEAFKRRAEKYGA